VSEQGVYEYIGEVQGVVVLAKRALVPNAKTVWLGEKSYHVDSYIAAEALIKIKRDAHRRLRSDVKEALNIALAKNKQAFARRQSDRA